MGNTLFIDLLEFLKTVNPLWIVLMEFLLAYGTVIAMFRFFGKEGMYVYVVMAIVLANIQILKLVSFPLISDPIPLGTIVFVSTYFATEIVNEHYGKEEALKLVALSFVSYFIFMMLMAVSLAFRPLSPEHLQGLDDVASYDWALQMQAHLEAIFTPAPSFFVSSLTAFGVSQVFNVFIFSALIKKWKRKYLGLRGFIASSLGSFIDNFTFSVLAFGILAKEPVSMHIIMFSYVLAVFYFRVVLAFFESPILYLSYKFPPKQTKP